MEISKDWRVLRIMFSEDAFGKTGNLTSDIINVCENMELDAIVFKDSGGYNVKGGTGSNYLFGGRAAAVPIIIEVVLLNDQVDDLKSIIIELLKLGKDNAAFYMLPAEGYIFDPERNKKSKT